MSTIRILKYPLLGEGAVTSFVCRRQRILDVQLQGSDIICWVETNDRLPEVTTKIISVGTGWEIDADAMKDTRYIKTVQDRAGYVWHFYEL